MMRGYTATGEIPTRRWEEAIAAEVGRFRALPAEADLVDIFSLHVERTVGKDGTMPFLGQHWPLSRGLHRHRVQLRWVPAERLWGLQGGHKVGEFLLSGTPCSRETGLAGASGGGAR